MMPRVKPEIQELIDRTAQATASAMIAKLAELQGAVKAAATEASVNEKFVRLPDVMQRLALSRSAVYRLIEAGELRPKKAGAALLFRQSDVTAYIERLAA